MLKVAIDILKVLQIFKAANTDIVATFAKGSFARECLQLG